MKPEAVILEALSFAKSQGCRILRGPIFDWCSYAGYPHESRLKDPPDCNALGAVLLMNGQERLTYPDFKPGWDKKLCDLLGAEWGWVWRFSHGWNRGNILTFEATIKGEDKIIQDEVSRKADRLARQWTVNP